MTMQEKERLVQLLTTKFNVDELQELTTLLKKDKCKVEILPIQNVSNCALNMTEILNEAIRRQANYSVQYADYSLETWTVASKLNEGRADSLLADGSVRKIRIEYEN